MTATLIKNTVLMSKGALALNDTISLVQTVKLSENKPSVKEVLFTQSVPVIQSTQCENGILSIKGDVYMNFLYSCESGQAESIREIIPFDYIRECSSDTECVMINAVVSHCDVAIKQRRCDIRLELTLNGQTVQNSLSDNVEDIDGVEGVIKRKKEMKTSVVNVIRDNTQHEFSIETDNKDSLRIVYASCSLFDENTTSSRNGILYSALAKADMIIEYENESGEYSYECLSDTFAINKMLETDINLQFDSYSLKADICTQTAETVYTDETCTLCINAEVYCEAVLLKDVTIEYIDDIYSTQKALFTQKEPQSIAAFKIYDTKSVELSKKKELSKESAINMVALSNAQIIYEEKSVDGNIVIEGNVVVRALLFGNTHGEFSVEEINIPFEEATEINSSVNSGYYLNSKCSISDLSVNANKLSAEVLLSLQFTAYDTNEYSTIKEIEQGDYEDNNDNTYSVKIYYYSHNKDLWDLAKENRTSIESILSSNGISDLSQLTERMPLIIK